MNKNRILICTSLVSIIIGSYSLISGTETIRNVDFLIIFSSGSMAGLLFAQLLKSFK